MTERAAFFLKLSFAPATLALAARAWEAIAAIVFEVRWWKVGCAEKSGPATSIGGGCVKPAGPPVLWSCGCQLAAQPIRGQHSG